MTLLLQLVLYCLIYILLVKYAVRDSGLNCLYFLSERVSGRGAQARYRR